MGKVIKGNFPRKEKEEEFEEEDKELGSIAWKRLKSKNPPRLNKTDRTIMASNLHGVITKRGLDPLMLAKKVWPDNSPDDQSRIKYRHLLPNNLSPEEREIRINNLSADKCIYRRFIEEILKASPGEDRNLLIDKLTFGTSLHPTAADLSEAEKLYSLLQRYILQIDEHHAISARYQSIRDEYEELIVIQGSPSNFIPLPVLNVKGRYPFQEPINWRKIIPFFPHVFLGIADQFDWISSLDDDPFWPHPSAIETAIKCFWEGKKPYAVDVDDDPSLEKEMEKWGAKTIGELSKKQAEYYHMQPKDHEWLHWHKVFITTLQDCFSRYPRIIWEITNKHAAPCLEDGHDLSSLDDALYQARRIYFLELIKYLDKHNIVIPDEVFTGELWNVDSKRALMEMVQLKCEEAQESLPPHAEQLYSSEEDTENIFDDYEKSRSSPVWLTIYHDDDNNALIPVVIFGGVEWIHPYSDGTWLDIYVIDSPRALLEIHRHTEFDIAWPSPIPIIKRIRELISDETIKQEWQRTVDFLKHHPLDKRYYEKQKIDALYKQEMISSPKSEE